MNQKLVLYVMESEHERLVFLMSRVEKGPRKKYLLSENRSEKPPHAILMTVVGNIFIAEEHATRL